MNQNSLYCHKKKRLKCSDERERFGHTAYREAV
jgi:hypothetical protein